jgi:hypothetical protein
MLYIIAKKRFNTMNKIIINVLKAPMVIIVILSLFLSLYAAYTKTYDIGYGTSIAFAIILILYFIGVYLERKKE